MNNYERRYGTWAGNRIGKILEDKTKCIEEVWGRKDILSHQCNFKRGYGKDGLYCKKHAKLNKKGIYD